MWGKDAAMHLASYQCTIMYYGGKYALLHLPMHHYVLQCNLSWETTAMRDHLCWRTTSFWQKDLHSSVYEPVTKDHLSWETIFLWLMGWSFKTGSTVLGKENAPNTYNLPCLKYGKLSNALVHPAAKLTTTRYNIFHQTLINIYPNCI